MFHQRAFLIILLMTVTIASVFEEYRPQGSAINNTAPLTLLKDFPHAKCLDGSSSGFYFRPASNDSTINRWMIVLEGGGFCTGKDDCQDRATTDLGSSSSWPKTFDFNSMPLTTTDKRNPFREWNLIFLPYCDGSMWAASRTSASNDTFGLWFSGHHTIVSTLDYFSQVSRGNLNATTDNDDQTFVLFSGLSAGGFGVFNNIDYMASRLPFATVVAAPIGGFPPRVEWYTGIFHTIPEEDGRNEAWEHHVKLYDSYLNQACLDHYTSNGYLCSLPYIMYPFIKQPMFIIEALSDSVVTCEFEGLPCSASSLLLKEVQNYLKSWGQNETKILHQLNTTRDGIFAPSCFMHCEFSLDQPMIRDVNVITALYLWAQTYMYGVMNAHHHTTEEFVYIDTCSSGSLWPPCNKNCP